MGPNAPGRVQGRQDGSAHDTAGGEADEGLGGPRQDGATGEVERQQIDAQRGTAEGTR
jgi:hypothetical protein